MKRCILLCIIVSLALAGCGSQSTKNEVYKHAWDERPIVVKQKNENGDYEVIHEIIESDQVQKLVKALKNATWQENIEVDSPPPDYRFTWNDFNHFVWNNQATERLELVIDGRSNYGKMSESSSKLLLEILTGD